MMATDPPLLRIRGPLSRGDLSGLYARACSEVGHTHGARLTVDVSEVSPNAVAVDALARLELAARRHGWRIVLRGACPELTGLIELMGLSEAFVSPAAAEARTGETAGPYPERT